MVTNRACPLCNKMFERGDTVVHVETIYRVGNLHTEATQFGEVAHLRCPDPEET